MARQYLINYHTSGATLPVADKLKLGEIAVQHNDVEQALIIKKTNGELVKFLPGSDLKNEISAASAATFETAVASAQSYTEVVSGYVATEINELAEKVISAITVNGVDAVVADGKATVALAASDIKVSNTTSGKTGFDNVDASLSKLADDVKHAIEAAGVTSFATKTGDITLKDESASDVAVVLSMNENELGAALKGIASSADTEAAIAAAKKEATDAASAYTDEEIAKLAEELADFVASAASTVAIEKEENKPFIVLKNADGEEISKADASEFVVDGMLSDVKYSAETHEMIFVWNADAGSKIVAVDLDDVMQPVTADSKTINAATDASGKLVFSAIMDQTDGVASYAKLGELSGVVETLEAEFESVSAKTFDNAENILAVSGDVIELSGAVETLVSESVKSVSINGAEFEAEDGKIEATVYASAITLGEEVKYSGETLAAATASVPAALEALVGKVEANEDAIKAVEAKADEAITGVTEASETLGAKVENQVLDLSEYSIDCGEY